MKLSKKNTRSVDLSYRLDEHTMASFISETTSIHKTNNCSMRRPK